MAGVSYHEPRALDEACELIQRYGEDGKVLAGGTALVLFMRQGLLAPEQLINIQHVEGLAGIIPATPSGERTGLQTVQPSVVGPRSFVSIGALTTHAQAARSSVLRTAYPALAETFARVATPRIRNAGTVGGNLAHGDPHLDPPVTLLALDAYINAQSVRGPRAIPLPEFFRDYYETALQPDELLTHILVPSRVPRSGLAFIKFLPRSQDDYATVDVAAWVQVSGASAGASQDSSRRPAEISLEDVRIALGSVGPVPFRAVEAERVLRGQNVTDPALAEAGDLAAAACDPEDDVRGSASYKRELVKVLVGRAVRQALADASAGV